MAGALRALRALLAPAAPPVPECGVCLKEVGEGARSACAPPPPGSRHFALHVCLQEHARAEALRRALGQVRCVGGEGCAAPPWALEELEVRLDKKTLVA